MVECTVVKTEWHSVHHGLDEWFENLIRVLKCSPNKLNPKELNQQVCQEHEFNICLCLVVAIGIRDMITFLTALSLFSQTLTGYE